MSIVVRLILMLMLILMLLVLSFCSGVFLILDAEGTFLVCRFDVE